MKIREEVQEFAETMEHVLQQNDHKTGWEDLPVEYLADKLTEEQEELMQLLNFKLAILKLAYADRTTLVREEALTARIKEECADVANIAMMISDNYGG